jgi:hypothetical protein
MVQATQATGSNPTQRQAPPEVEIEIIEEGGTAVTATTPVKEGGQQATGQGYDYPEDGEDDGRQQTGDTRTGQVSGGGETQAEAGGTTEQTARQRRRQRDNERRRADRAELVTLRQEVARLKGRFEEQDARIANSEAQGIDGQIANVEAEIARAATIMSRAMAAQNGDDFAKAMEIRDALRDQRGRLLAQKESMGGSQTEEGAATGGRVQRADPRQLSAQQVQFARIFATRHPWYKHGSADQDSQMVVQLDNEMTAQGLNPSTPEYWMELETRIREEMPHKFQTEGAGGQGGQKVNGNGQQNGTGNTRTTGGPKLPGSGNAGGSGASSGGPIKFHLSPARKQALVDLGVWDDPEQRMKHIRRFVEWDKANPSKE